MLDLDPTQMPAARPTERVEGAGTRARTFQLFFAGPHGPGGPADSPWSVVEVPPGVSHLAAGSGGRADCLELRAGAPASGGPAALLFEPVEIGGRPRLLAASVRGFAYRVNGVPAPLVALLTVADQLLVHGRVVHVGELRDGGPAPLPEELAGSLCGLCRLPLVAGDAVYRCDCGVALHFAPEEGGAARAEEERLQCALLGDCPSCGAVVSTEGGPVWLPEGFDASRSNGRGGAR